MKKVTEKISGNAWIFEEKQRSTGKVIRRVLYGSVSAMFSAETFNIRIKYKTKRDATVSRLLRGHEIRTMLRENGNKYTSDKYNIEKLPIKRFR